ncbi:Uridine-cytidine kinase-like 1 [Armadillidium nasatum]|uniref:uridine/cytidine kinase n=1 Tax=Armadillidium nasatum TaxID=96803 RepID=A0A5N5SWA3_9CRUS|nr:Uridine-cytidine kinase-like 1 [Armadillidium nasatum]
MPGKINLDLPNSFSLYSGGKVLERPVAEMMVKDNDFAKGAESLEDPESPMQNPEFAGVASQLSGGGPIRSPRMHRQRTSSQTTSNKNKEPILRGSRNSIYIADRLPRYDCHGQLVEPFIIGICGGSASGKTSFARKIIEKLNVPWVTLLSLDSFYKVLSAKQLESAAKNEYNFDHPDAFDFELVVKTLKCLKDGTMVQVPIYNFLTHRREARTKPIHGANVVIFKGILSFYSKDALKLLDMKVFLDTDSDDRLALRLLRDVSERERNIDDVMKQYFKFVKPGFDYYVAPLKVHADIIVPRGWDNEVAINLIVQNVMSHLQRRGFNLIEKFAVANFDLCHPTSLHLLPNTPQIKVLHYFIRKKDTPSDKFIFYSKRLIRLVIEYALTFLTSKDVVGDTTQGVPCERKEIVSEIICGAFILRAGENMENAFCEVLKDLRIENIFVLTNLGKIKPELSFPRLPKSIRNYHIFLIGATVETGAAAIMAIRVLIDQEVPEENIIICSLLMTEQSVHNIVYAFPKVKIVTTAVDQSVSEIFYNVPGVINFGDRHFGKEQLFLDL